jgi:hypothetical protein
LIIEQQTSKLFPDNHSSSYEIEQTVANRALIKLS